MYDPKSRQADDFINHQEIEDTLAYAEEHKSDRALIESLINKSLTFKGLTHREAAVLLACDLPDCNEKIMQAAIKVKEHIYGKRIVLFAPCTSPTTASTPAHTARTTPKTRTSSARSSPRTISAVR